jgi:hypothetical protein
MDQQEENFFQIALVNHRPAEDRTFDWGSFQSSAVKKASDLPAYLIAGPRQDDAFVRSSEGWYAKWDGGKTGGTLNVTWTQAAKKYLVEQKWLDAKPVVAEVDFQEPFFQAVSSVYAKGFPEGWDEKAKDYFESKYQVSWIQTPSELPLYFGAPDGVFYAVSFPVMIKNLRNAQHILENIAKDPALQYGFFVTAAMTDQTVYYTVGVAPEWTADIAQCLTQSLGETGLLPLEIPSLEETGGVQYVKLERSVMMVRVCVPFTQLDDMLSRLAETPMPIYKTDDNPYRRETLPIITPVNIAETGQSIRVIDSAQGVTSIYGFLPDQPLDALLKEGSEGKIAKLEQLSDQMIQQVLEATGSQTEE